MLPRAAEEEICHELSGDFRQPDRCESEEENAA
jgi:hypothetical protein